MSAPLEHLSNCVEIAHTRIQKDYTAMNPVVGVSQKLRPLGIPADVMTIDCLKTKKRIIVVLHDEMPSIVRFQFSYIDRDPGDDFHSIALSDFSEKHLYDWMKDYFS